MVGEILLLPSKPAESIWWHVSDGQPADGFMPRSVLNIWPGLTTNHSTLCLNRQFCLNIIKNFLPIVLQSFPKVHEYWSISVVWGLIKELLSPLPQIHNVLLFTSRELRIVNLLPPSDTECTGFKAHDVKDYCPPQILMYWIYSP